MYPRPCGCTLPPTAEDQRPAEQRHTGTPFELGRNDGRRSGVPIARPWPASCPTPWSRAATIDPGIPRSLPWSAENQMRAAIAPHRRPDALANLTEAEREKVLAELEWLLLQQNAIRRLMHHPRTR
jgi:hypothetical protein